MDSKLATRKQVMNFRKKVREDFGYIVRIKTVNFMDLARCSITFARVVGGPHRINVNDFLQAKVLARQFNIILEDGIVFKED